MTVRWEHRDADGDVAGFDVDVDDTTAHLQAEYGCVYITPEAALALAIELFRWAAPQVPPAANQAHADITDLLTELGITMQRPGVRPETQASGDCLSALGTVCRDLRCPVHFPTASMTHPPADWAAETKTHRSCCDSTIDTYHREDCQAPGAAKWSDVHGNDRTSLAPVGERREGPDYHGKAGPTL